jgi:hypothetical protein
LKGKRRFKSDLVPALILVARYFVAERDAIEALDNQLAALEQQLDEMREEGSGEDGLLVEVIEGEGEPGRLYHVQGSFDLQDWIFVGRVIALGGEFKITDPKNTAFKEEFTGEPGNRIFYRLTLPEE